MGRFPILPPRSFRSRLEAWWKLRDGGCVVGAVARVRYREGKGKAGRVGSGVAFIFSACLGVGPGRFETSSSTC